MAIKEYHFNTGVRPFDFNPPAGMAFMEGFKDSGNGVYVIPFECEEVPEGAKHTFSTDTFFEESPGFIRREIVKSIAMKSKYAYFITNPNHGKENL